MRITYDREVDALYIRFTEATVTTKKVGEGIAVDYDAEGRLAGVEILDAAKRLGDPAVLRRVTAGNGPERLPTPGGESRLEELKRRHFTPEGKAERVARALAALNEEQPISLTPEQWRQVVEDSPYEDQY